MNDIKLWADDKKKSLEKNYQLDKNKIGEDKKEIN